MTEMFRRAHEHQGAAFVEVYQNCNVFNDGAFDTILNKDARPDMLIDLKHGEPVRFGTDGQHGVVMNEFGEAKIVDVADVGVDKLVVHDETRADPSLAFALSRLAEHPETPTPVGVFRAVDRPAYGVAMQQQLVGAVERSGPGDLARAAALGADLDGRVAAEPSAARLSRACGTPCRCAAWARRTSSSAACARGRSPRPACPRPTPVSRGSRRSPSPLSTSAATPCASWRYCHVASARRGTTSASMTAASVAATAGCSSASAAARTSARGTASARPLVVDEPEAVLGAHRALERVDAVGRVRAQRRARRTRRRGGPARRCRRARR